MWINIQTPSDLNVSDFTLAQIKENKVLKLFCQVSTFSYCQAKLSIVK